MAQRTGAKRFLAPAAKATSARVTLALVAAAFLLAGCGGGSEDPDSQGTASSAQAGQGAGTSAGAAGAAQGTAQSKSKPGQAGSASAGDGAKAAGSQGQGGNSGQKQGPAITQPKGPPEQAPSAEQIATATVADMSLRSPAILAANGNPGALAPTYTCDGKDSWPELRWGGVPPDTAELALYVMNVQPIEGQLFVDWALAGLDPGLTGIEAGQLPKGAITGTNGFGKRGYSICPAGSGEIYMFAIYALPTRLSPPQGFDARQLRKEILDVSGNVGLLPAVYARG